MMTQRAVCPTLVRIVFLPGPVQPAGTRRNKSRVCDCHRELDGETASLTRALGGSRISPCLGHSRHPPCSLSILFQFLVLNPLTRARRFANSGRPTTPRWLYVQVTDRVSSSSHRR